MSGLDQFYANRRTEEEKRELERNASRVRLVPGDPAEAVFERHVAAEAQNARDGIVDLGNGNKVMANRYGTGFVTRQPEGPRAPGVIQDERGVVNLDALRKGKLEYQADPLRGTPAGTVSGIDPGRPKSEIQGEIAQGAAALLAGERGVSDRDAALTAGLAMADGMRERAAVARAGDAGSRVTSEWTPGAVVATDLITGETEVVSSGAAGVPFDGGISLPPRRTNNPNATPVGPNPNAAVDPSAPRRTNNPNATPVGPDPNAAVDPSVPRRTNNPNATPVGPDPNAAASPVVPRRTTSPHATPVGPDKNSPEYLLRQAGRMERRGRSREAAGLRAQANAIAAAQAQLSGDALDQAKFAENKRQFDVMREDRAAEFDAALQGKADDRAYAAAVAAEAERKKGEAEAAKDAKASEAEQKRIAGARERLDALVAQGVVSAEQAESIRGLSTAEAITAEVARVARGTKPAVVTYIHPTNGVQELPADEWEIVSENRNGRVIEIPRRKVKGAASEAAPAVAPAEGEKPKSPSEAAREKFLSKR